MFLYGVAPGGPGYGGMPVAPLGGVFAGGMPLAGPVTQIFRGGGGPLPPTFYGSTVSPAGPIGDLFVGISGAPLGAAVFGGGGLPIGAPAPVGLVEAALQARTAEVGATLGPVTPPAVFFGGAGMGAQPGLVGHGGAGIGGVSGGVGFGGGGFGSVGLGGGAIGGGGGAIGHGSIGHG